MNKYQIPFNRPYQTGHEQELMSAALENNHISGDGPFTKACHNWLEKQLGATKALLTTSCTHALEMSALLLDIQPGDEIIFPAFTFVSTVNAFILRGARPVFADIRRDTLNIDEKLLERIITDRTRAIVVVHYAGVGCEMEPILDLAARHNLVVIEDNAHGLLGRYNNQLLGTFGSLATQSFHETKNFTCGEGGALIINKPDYIERAEIIREKGTNRSRFFRGQVDKYTWVDLGSSYLPSDLLAAFLYAQFKAADKIQSRRKLIWDKYQTELHQWAESHDILQPYVPPQCAQAYHMYYLLMPDLSERQRLILHLKERGILAVFHYLPLHLSRMGRLFGGQPGDCPVTEEISDRIIRLPFYTGLSSTDQEFVITSIMQFYQ